MSELNDRAYTYYRYFLAMKLHFKDKKFNFFSHDGKTRVSVQTYNGRRDRYFFERSASIYNTQKFLDKCLTEIKKNPNFFIKDLLTPDNESRYLRRKGFLESFKNSFDKEVSEITNHCLKNRINRRQLLQGDEDTKPVLYLMLKKGLVSEETYLCIDRVCDVSERLAVFNLDPLVHQTNFFMEKYYPFVVKHFPKKDETQTILSNSFDLLSQ